MPDKPKILLVDDNLEVLNSTRSLLNIMGFNVTTATSALHALSIVQTDETFFMVISDYEMPGLKGTELLKRIQKYCPSIIRILCSGNLCKNEAEEFIRCGISDRFIAKPWNSTELINLIYEEVACYVNRTNNMILKEY